MRGHSLTKALDARDATKAHAIADSMAKADLHEWLVRVDPDGDFDDLDLADLRANAHYIIDGSL